MASLASMALSRAPSVAALSRSVFVRILCSRRSSPPATAPTVSGMMSFMRARCARSVRYYLSGWYYLSWMLLLSGLVVEMVAAAGVTFTHDCSTREPEGRAAVAKRATVDLPHRCDRAPPHGCGGSTWPRQSRQAARLGAVEPAVGNLASAA